MIQPAMLLAMGLAMLWWCPCRGREGRAPRAALALLILSAAAVWLGSLGLIVISVAGEGGGLLAACGAVWDRLVAVRATPGQTALLLAWAVALPLRGLWVTAGRVTTSQRLLRRLSRLATSTVSTQTAARALLVPGLGTPAITLGMVRPVVLVDAAFWSSASATERAVVLAHEDAHRRGRHGLVEALVGLLTAGLAPLPGAREAHACARRHLEALADDVAADRLGPQTVGVTLGRVALGAVPASGLGAAGNALWRVSRLIAPTRSSSWRDRAVLGVNAGVLAVGLMIVAAGTATAMTPQFCPL